MPIGVWGELATQSKEREVVAGIVGFVGGVLVTVLVGLGLGLIQLAGAAILRLGLRVVLEVFGMGVLGLAVLGIWKDRQGIFVNAKLEGEPAAAIVSAISMTVLLLAFPAVGVLSFAGIAAASLSQVVLLAFTVVFALMAVAFNVLTFRKGKPISFQLPGVILLVAIGAGIIGSASVL